jgi:hypothetical protein
MAKLNLKYSSTAFGLGDKPIELHKDSSQKIAEISGTLETTAECNLWLPAAAKHYQISPNIKDYILVPTPSIISCVPNTNGDSVTIQEFLRFSPKMGMQAFKTFRGKPTHLEHDNKDITRAKGVILDSFLRPLKGFGNNKYWKLVLLSAFDRTKDPQLTKAILSGEVNSYSIGFYFQSYTCSYCGHKCGLGGYATPCEHTAPRKPTYELNGRLVYRQCGEIEGFENSAVGSPAYVSAISSKFMNLSEY